MIPSFIERNQLRSEVELCVRANNRNAQVKMIGSSSFMLFSENSDVDLCIFSSSSSANSSPLKILRPLMEAVSVMFPGSTLEDKPSVPCIKLLFLLMLSCCCCCCCAIVVVGGVAIV